MRYRTMLMQVGLLLLVSLGVSAEELESDRPDFTEGTGVVALERFQIEGGYTLTYDSTPGPSDHVLPELLTRFGVLPEVELRIGWEGYSSQEEGVSELSIGYKQRVYRGEQFAFSYILELGLPTGTSERRSEEVAPGLKGLFAAEVSEGIGLGVNSNLGWDPEVDRYSIGASASLSKDFSPVVGGYVEYFGEYASGELPPSHYGNLGLTYLYAADLQFDVRFGVGLNTSASDGFVGGGFAWRY